MEVKTFWTSSSSSSLSTRRWTFLASESSSSVGVGNHGELRALDLDALGLEGLHDVLHLV